MFINIWNKERDVISIPCTDFRCEEGVFTIKMRSPKKGYHPELTLGVTHLKDDIKCVSISPMGRVIKGEEAISFLSE